MHIEISRTARRFHLPPDIAQAFIEAGLATEVPKEKLQPIHVQQPIWVVNRSPYTDAVRIVLTKFGETVEFPGPNGGTLEQALAAFEKMGFPVPQHVVGEYCRLAGIQEEVNAAKWNAATERGVQQG